MATDNFDTISTEPGENRCPTFHFCERLADPAEGQGHRLDVLHADSAFLVDHVVTHFLYGRFKVTATGDKVTTMGDKVTTMGDKVTTMGDKVTTGDKVTATSDKVTTTGVKST